MSGRFESISPISNYRCFGSHGTAETSMFRGTKCIDGHADAGTTTAMRAVPSLIGSIRISIRYRRYVDGLSMPSVNRIV
jgi:hypothetical protein